MENSLTRYERLDMYLDQLETLQRRRRQKQWFAVSLLVIILSGTSAAFFFFPKPVAQQVATFTPEFRRFLSDSLSPERVQNLFVEEGSPIVVLTSTPINSVDTVASLDEYYQYLNEINLLKVEEPDPVDPAYLPTFVVEVEGEKIVNQPLTYIIDGFDPSYDLILDFGNGIERTAKSATMTYTYPLPGHFDMHLVLNTADTTMIMQTIKYQILPQEEGVVNTDEGLQPSVAQGL